jgi:hypothetical protein
MQVIFAVHLDSETGAEISLERGPFTRDFVRNYVPDSEQLPYRIMDQKLFNIVT